MEPTVIEARKNGLGHMCTTCCLRIVPHFHGKMSIFNEAKLASIRALLLLEEELSANYPIDSSNTTQVVTGEENANSAIFAGKCLFTIFFIVLLVCFFNYRVFYNSTKFHLLHTVQ